MEQVAAIGSVKKWIMLGAVLGLAGWGTGTAWAAGEGTAGAPFLKIGTSARAEALGGAYTAVVDDVDATYWNPAGLTQLQRSSIGLTHLEWFQDIRYEYVAYADKYDYVGAVGVGVGYLYLGDIPKTVETASGDYDPINSGGTFGASDMLIQLAWANDLGVPENKIGVGVKIIQKSIDSNSSFSVGLDVGDQLLLSRMDWVQKLGTDNWAVQLIPDVVGFTLKNLGSPVKFFNQNDPLPMSASLGVAYGFLEDALTAALDIDYQAIEGELGVHAGLEYWFNTGIASGPEQTLDVALRAGYRTMGAASAAPGISLGAGVQYGFLGLDYVFMPFGDLGSTHRISLKYSWGDILKDKQLMKGKPTQKIVRKELSPSEEALDETAQKMVESKRSMEDKVVVQKAAPAKRELTAVEAKKPEERAVIKETKSMGAEVKGGDAGTRSVAISKGAVIKDTGTKIDKDLIAKITQSQQQQDAGGRENRYTRRTQADVVRSARREAEMKSMEFEAVEEAAKEEAQQSRAQTLGQTLVTKTTVYFATNSGQLSDRYLFALDKIAYSFDRYPQRTILVHGYAASDEKDVSGLSLSRAKAVRDYLVQIKSIPSNKISLKGFGDKDPVSTENTPRGRAMNRRVRIELIKTGN